MNLFYDESGDLGFSFDKPYKQGGSSRYLTIGFVLCPFGGSIPIRRLVRKLYNRKHCSPSSELKGSDLLQNDKIWFASKLSALANQHQDIQFFAITIKKARVFQHIREDPNKLYNYATYLAIKDRVNKYTDVHLYPDPRSIKVRSGNSHIDYLQTTMWFQSNSSVKFSQHQVLSQDSKALQCADIMTNIIWGYYEFRHTQAYNIIRSGVDLEHLFF